MARVGNLIVVGTYEEFVLGYAIVPDEKDDKKLSLVQTFACHSHHASVRSLAVGGVHLASGSTDETIRLYNIVNQVESGLLNHHVGSTVNALAFTEDGTHLISGGADGTIAVTRTGSWFVEKKWTGTHSGFAVTAISVHPSGKLALSVGADNRIVTWNLVKGRKAYITNVASRCHNGWGIGDVQWSPTGSFYAVYMSSHAEVYSVASAGVVHTISCSNRVSSIVFLEDDVLLVGEESGEASIHKLKSPAADGTGGEMKEVARFQAHDRRVKCAKNLGPIADGARSATLFVTAGGSGHICLWEIEDSEVVKLCDVGTGCRVTCMTVVDLEKELKLKKEGDAVKDAAQARVDTAVAETRKKIESARKRRLSEGSEATISNNKRVSSPKLIKISKTNQKTRSKLLKKQPAIKKTKKSKSESAGQWLVTPLE